MKKYVFEFLRRGFAACGIGPLVLAMVYMILQRQTAVYTLTVHQVCTGIFSLSALAFVAGGMNVIYQMEKLPLMAAIFIHGCVLYVCYLVTYLLNDWLVWGVSPVLVFSGIFVFGYLAIWEVIYFIIRRRTEKINEVLKKKQQ